MPVAFLLRAFARLSPIHVLMTELGMDSVSPNSLLLRGARIIAPDRLIQQGSVLIEADRIARVFDAATSQPPAPESVIDLNGLTLFPGFIDVHIHGAIGVDTMAASADDLCRVAEFLARNGVTGWLPTLVPSAEEQYAGAIQVIEAAMQERTQEKEQAGSLRSRLLGVHYEGPFVNSEQCGALHREHFRTFSGTADVDALPTLKNESDVHMMTLAPEIEGGIELIRELRARGWIVSLGHTRATAGVLDQALQAGAHHLTHFMNAMPPLHHRAPGPVGWGLLHDDVTCDVIADGIHIDPVMLKLILRGKTTERVSLISDAIAAAGLGDGDYEIWGERIAVKNGRTQNARGSIAGSVITMLDAVRMMSSLGAPEVEVARMASTNPARLLSIDRDCGSIAKGKRADLVAVDDELNVRLVMIGGQKVSEARP
jgi:N-acetylglucosamine-6-phosphate deacetylase